MAELRKHALAILPMKQTSQITFLYNVDFGTPVKRIWGDKEVNRYLFKISETEGKHWFECGPQLTEEIKKCIDMYIFCNDVDQFDKISLFISKTNGQYHAAISDKNDFSKSCKAILAEIQW